MYVTITLKLPKGYYMSIFTRNMKQSHVNTTGMRVASEQKSGKEATVDNLRLIDLG